MEVGIKIDNESLKRISEQKIQIKKGTLEGMRKAMFYVENKSKSRFNTPGNLRVRTGRLRGSIRTNVKQLKHITVGSIGTNVIYGPVHEFGYPPRNIPTRPFLSPAITENIDEINKMIAASIDKEVK